ncbi:hypothetical protein [Mycoplasmopsis cynos]|uniref:hypothetical protein n=1 Tax=Mycoplasmopsis cynos TaxID=171284 RepID=UPI002AFE5FA2|nr:hypothetical protein [Mycoplasmopsis cynos]WQQ17381.1 hypothetical protein RRG56_02385 [Mycoplasmopsis cynos]
MYKRKQKKIFLGFSILSFLISGIATISTIWSSNKIFSEYDNLYKELKKARDLVMLNQYRKKADVFLNNPVYKVFSKENAEEIKNVLEKIKVQIDKEIKVIISEIKSKSKKDKLNVDLLSSQNSLDKKRKIKENAIKLTEIELAKDRDLEKIEAKKLVERVKNSNKKKEFENRLFLAKNNSDFDLLIFDIEKELLSQGLNDYILAKKYALDAKIKVSKLKTSEKNKLSKLIKDSKTTSSLFDNEIIINYEIIKLNLKKQVEERIENIKDSNFKKSIQDLFDKAKTIRNFYDILNKINEYEFRDRADLEIDPKDKTDLLNKIDQIRKIITPSDDKLANDIDIKNIIDETILSLKNSIARVKKDDVFNKKDELDKLKIKLIELKNEIDNIKNTEVLEFEKIKKELAKKLAKSKDDQSIEDTKLYIKKAKLKKKASELPYPNGVDSVAIYEINSRINSAKKDNLKSIEDLISKLPKKISEAKKLIEEVKQSGKDTNGERSKDLNNQLSRSVDDEDFDKLNENIQKAKSQSDEEYKKDLARRLKDQVDGLHYPKNAMAKENLKAQIDKLTDQKLTDFSKTLDQIAKNVELVKSSIDSIPKRNDEDQKAINEFNKIFSTADNVKKLKDLKKLVDNYSDIANKLNLFAPYDSLETYQEDLISANNALNELKLLLWSKLAKITRFNSQQALRKLIDANFDLYNETKKFSGDILAAVHFLNEARSKTDIKQINEIKNKIQLYKDQLIRFWTQEKGDFLKNNKDSWITSIPEGDSNPNLEKYRFLSYKLLLKKLRTRQNSEQVKKIVDVEIDQYKALIEFKKAYDQVKNSIPNNVYESLKTLILNVPENATKYDMDHFIKYLGQRIEKDGDVTSGFYLDAKYLLDSLNNYANNKMYKDHYKALFDKIGADENGKSYDENIIKKIDNFRKEIKELLYKLNAIAELEKKKVPLFEELKKHKDSADKKELLNQLKDANNAVDIDKIKERINLISQKEKLKTEISNLELFDLSGHQGRNGLSSSQLSMLNMRITKATTSQELNNIENDINKQKTAEINDLAIEKSNGGTIIDLQNGTSKYEDYSEMKKFLISIISGIKTIKGLENPQAQSQFTEEGTKLQNKILSTKNVEDYKKVKQEAEAFAKKWEAGATRNWVRFFVERVEKHSNQSPQEAGPFPVDVPRESIHSIKSNFENPGTTREQAIKLENDYLKTIYFNARRLKKLDYDYLQFIKYLKQNPFLDDNELSRLDAQYNRFNQAPSIEAKENVALSIERSLVGGRIDIIDLWRKSSQKEFVDWWVDTIVNAPENIISQESKYTWIDRITLTIDERKEVAKSLWEEFKKQYPSLLSGHQLDSQGFPQRFAPSFR